MRLAKPRTQAEERSVNQKNRRVLPDYRIPKSTPSTKLPQDEDLEDCEIRESIGGNEFRQRVVKPTGGKRYRQGSKHEASPAPKAQLTKKRAKRQQSTRQDRILNSKSRVSKASPATSHSRRVAQEDLPEPAKSFSNAAISSITNVTVFKKPRQPKASSADASVKQGPAKHKIPVHKNFFANLRMATNRGMNRELPGITTEKPFESIIKSQAFQGSSPQLPGSREIADKGELVQVE
ncbi:MAG: hypothetical protein Q9218_003432 [Villophora microphyllina]